MKMKKRRLLVLILACFLGISCLCETVAFAAEVEVNQGDEAVVQTEDTKEQTSGATTASEQRTTTEEQQATTTATEQATTTEAEQATVENADKTGSTKPTLFILGDSKGLYCGPVKYPRTGWVQELMTYFTGSTGKISKNLSKETGFPNVVEYDFSQFRVENWSKGGLSAKTAKTKGRFNAINKRMKAGDCLVIALGHNDARSWGESVSSFKKYLTNMAKTAKKKNVKLIFITTPPCNSKKYTIMGPAYRKATKAIAKKYKSPCVDLNKICVNYFNFLGQKKCNSWYLRAPAGKYSHYPKGVKDNSHFNRSGSRVIARIIMTELQNDAYTNFFESYYKVDTKSLYRTYHKALKYKKSKYTQSSWNRMVKARNQAWKALYSPSKNTADLAKYDKKLKSTMKNLRKIN